MWLTTSLQSLWLVLPPIYWMRKSYVLPGVRRGTGMLRICVQTGPFRPIKKLATMQSAFHFSLTLANCKIFPRCILKY